MALTQLQKKQLDILENDPQDFLLKLQSKNIIINNFKGEFYQNGKGIYHILVNSMLLEQDPIQLETYFQIFSIINDSSISPVQNSGLKTSAIDDLMTFTKENLNENTLDIGSTIIKKCLTKEINSKEPNKNTYIQTRMFNYILEYTEDFEFLIQCTGKAENENLKNDWIKTLIKRTIIQNDSNQLRNIIKKLNIEENKEFLHNITYGNREENYNLLAYSLKKKAYNVSNYIISDLPQVSITGFLDNTEKYLQQKRVNTVDIALREFEQNENIDIEKLTNITFKILEKSNVYNLLTSQYNFKYPSNQAYRRETNSNGFTSKPIIDTLLDTESTKYKTIEYIDEIFKSQNNTSAEKILLLNKILNTRSISIIYEIFCQIKDNIPNWEDSDKMYSYLHTEDYFESIFKDKKDKTLDKNEERMYLEIFEELNNKNYFSKKNKLFNEVFLFNPNIAKNILKKITFNSVEHNIYEHFFNKNLKNSITIPEIALDTFKVIKENNLNYLQEKCSGDKTLLEFFMIDCNNNENLISIFDIKDIKKTIQNGSFSDTIFAQYRYKFKTEKDSETFDNLIKDLISIDFKFFDKDKENKNHHLYYLFDTLKDKRIIDEICLKQNIDFKIILNDVRLWQNVKNDETFEYIKTKIDNDNIKVSEKIVFQLMHSSYKNSLAFLIQLNDNKIIQNENLDTLLHIAVKYDQYEIAQKVVELIPGISLVDNNQKKSALSYLFVDFNKECNINEKPNRYNRPTIVKDTFYKIVDQGVTKNQRAKKIIEKQFEKYPIILEQNPDLKYLFMVKKLEVSLDRTTEVIRKKKI